METEWQTYRTRFLVKAKQLDAPLSFCDSLGREHAGVAGDYLVEFADGVLRIAPRELFEDIYVLMETERRKRPCSTVPNRNHFVSTALYSKMLSS